MTDPALPRPTRFRTGGLSPRKPTRFDYVADGAGRAALAAGLGLLALRDLRLSGEIQPKGRDELLLVARLVADADQACVVTLAPVPVRVEEEVVRRYVAGLSDTAGEEVEMPEDETVEAMPEAIDLTEIATEALALALPLYPRAPGAEFGAAVHSAPGVAPITDADLKPFAGLAALAQGAGKPDPDRS